jgi:hypothetical protein
MMQTRFSLVLSLVAVWALAACPAPPPPAHGPGYAPPPPAAGQPAPAQPGSETVPAQPAETPPDHPQPPPPPPAPPPAAPLAQDGARCSQASDCQSGICEGEGCGANGGICAVKNRACTKDYRAYCGCDGVTFHGSGSCPGRRYAHRGECKSTAKREAGSPCATASQCQSGICEGEGCGDAETGTCAPRQRACTRDLRAYCGCDGKTFRPSGSCPGRRYQHREACGSVR